MCELETNRSRVRLALSSGSHFLSCVTWEAFGHELLSCASLEKVRSVFAVMCDRTCKMVGQEPFSPRLMVFMTEEETLWHELKCIDS